MTPPGARPVMRDLFTHGPGPVSLGAGRGLSYVSFKARVPGLAYGRGVGCTRAA